MRIWSALVIAIVLAACGGSSDDSIAEGACQIADPSAPPDDLDTVTCKADFDALAALPLDTTLPSATSLKVVLDQADQNHLYFTNTQKYPIHYKFCSANLSGNGLPTVPELSSFNSTEYFSPERRFILGAVTYYATPDKWVLELSPYDTASVDMIVTLFRATKKNAYFGKKLAFHPTSEALSAVAAMLPSDIPIVTTDDIYAGIDYQPLSLGVAVGTLHFTTADSINAGEYVSPYTILVMDSAPNDMSVVQGTITQDFQTPLSHINVLAHTRRIPNMGLRDAVTNPQLLALKDQLAKLTTTPEGWTIEPISADDAQAYWDAHAPAPVTLPTPDLTVTTLASITDVTPDPTGTQTLLGNLQKAMTAYGGKAAHYSTLYKTPGVPIRNAFAIPVFYYNEFMTQNGFYTRVQNLLADSSFKTNATVREQQLTQLRDDMISATLPADLVTALQSKIAEPAYAAIPKFKFRSSSNSEDVSGFPCAGCYDSFGGKRDDLDDMETAIKQTYASVWTFRGFELRSYYGVAHDAVGMSILVHENFPDEASNGVAITANPFDAAGLDPAFYINVQLGGDVEVVAPPPGVTSDQFLYYFSQPNQPISFIAHSSLTGGANVMTTEQTYELGQAMQALHDRFSAAYGPGAGNNGWYAMDIEFKFDNTDDPSKPPHCYIKQARPYADPTGGSQ
ncbi:MAG TPA: PEP/pyruvate-binding domain-containing protein [Kofleriaceae bacterium]|jgi:hypothetical protein